MPFFFGKIGGAYTSQRLARFYSLYSSGELDTFSWHCACPVVQGTKWAANSWAWNQPISTGPFARRKPKAKAKGNEL